MPDVVRTLIDLACFLLGVNGQCVLDLLIFISVTVAAESQKWPFFVL